MKESTRRAETSFPGIAAHCRAIDLPYFWSNSEVNENPPVGAPSFGYFGNAGSGLSQYIQLADAINQEGRDVQFWLAGHLKYREKYSSYAGLVNGLTAEPLSNEEYARRAEGITMPWA